MTPEPVEPVPVIRLPWEVSPDDACGIDDDFDDAGDDLAGLDDWARRLGPDWLQ